MLLISCPSCPNQRNWFCISLLLTIMVIGLLKPCTKKEVAVGLAKYDVYFKTRNVDVTSFQDKKCLEYISGIRNTIMRIF
jgi:hypothetical protein